MIYEYFFKDIKYCDWANPNMVGVSGKNITQEHALLKGLSFYPD
jgi:hypothetical protein